MSKSSNFGNLDAASAVPPQQEYSPGPDPGPPPPFLAMDDLRANDCIVRDISLRGGGDGWRWTYLSPMFKFYVKDPERRRFVLDFLIADATFKDTGPVTLSCYVGDKLLGTLRCPHPGQYHFEHPVPATWLTGTPVLVRAELDKVWTAPSDGARLGYLLHRAGFPQS